MPTFEDFFPNQIGGRFDCDSYGRRGRVYGQQQQQHQQGSGVGAFLKGLYRRSVPFVKRGATVVGNEVVRSGAKLLDDIVTNNRPIKVSINQNIRKSGGGNLKRQAENVLDKLVNENTDGDLKYKKKRHNVKKRHSSIVRKGGNTGSAAKKQNVSSTTTTTNNNTTTNNKKKKKKGEHRSARDIFEN